MSKVLVMDADLANKIAAGEVVEKVVSVVKELVENSIDAGSTEIKIELIDSGVKEICVTDNGIGMDEEDAVLCFSRHATSKLKTLDDLFNIESLGFRGEALPSIASVSNTILQTYNGKTGTEVSGTTSSSNVGFKINVANDLGKGNTLRIFRGPSSGTYTSYVDIPNPKTVNLYDNGYSINGYKWKTINSADVVTTTNGIPALNRTDIYDKVLVRGYGYSEPSLGTWKQGDIIERQNPSAGGNCGWVCTAEGTPGTWKPFGSISS